MKPKYYFKFIVPSYYQKEFNTYTYANRFAKKQGEKVYLTIFNSQNKCFEPYAERVINSIDEIEIKKKELIQVFENLIK